MGNCRATVKFTIWFWIFLCVRAATRPNEDGLKISPKSLLRFGKNMNRFRFLAITLAALFCGDLLAQDRNTRTLDSEVSALAEKLAAQIKESGRKRITVLDFADLQGNSTELGRFLAEQVSVSLVERRNGFSVMDRAN